MFKIVIDPGHGGKDRFNKGFSGEYVEADGALAIGKKLFDKLTEYADVQVILTRYDDITVPLVTRGQIAAGADLFISIHTNGCGYPNVRGSEVFYSVDRPEDEGLAALLSQYLADTLRVNNRGAKTRESLKHPGEDYLTVIDTAEDYGCKHVLLSEADFHTNALAEKALMDPVVQDQIASSHLNAFVEYFGLRPKAIESDVPEPYRIAWAKAVAKGIEDGIGPNEVVTSAKLMTYFDKLKLLD